MSSYVTKRAVVDTCTVAKTANGMFFLENCEPRYIQGKRVYSSEIIVPVLSGGQTMYWPQFRNNFKIIGLFYYVVRLDSILLYSHVFPGSLLRFSLRIVLPSVQAVVLFDHHGDSMPPPLYQQLGNNMGALLWC